ncbi:hypothetical protein SRHO_G00099640 [Serrasalmus rhombeus]
MVVLRWPDVESTKASEKKTQSTQTEQEWSASRLWTALLVVGGVVLLLALASLSTRKGFSKRKEDCEMPYDDVYTTVEYATSSKA